MGTGTKHLEDPILLETYCFDELAPLPYFERAEPKVKRKKTFKSFWMSSDNNYETVKRVETETAKKKADKEEDEKIAKEAVAKSKKK